MSKKKEPGYDRKRTLRLILAHIGSYKWGLAVSILLAAVSVALTLYIPLLVGDAIDCIIGAGNVDFAAIAKILVKIAVSTGLIAAAQWLMNALNNRITYRIVRDIRNEAFEKIERLPLAYLDAHPSGEIVSRVIADTDTFADGVMRLLPDGTRRIVSSRDIQGIAPGQFGVVYDKTRTICVGSGEIGV